MTNNNEELWYPRPTGNETESFTDFFLHYPNTLTNEMFGIALLFIVFGISFFSLNQYPIRQAFAASTFLTMITTALLVASGAVPSQTLAVVVLMLLAAITLVRGGGTR